MKIKFQTKEESKKQQLEDFLKLSGGERVWCFFSLSAQINRFPHKNKIEKTHNFVIHFDLNKTKPNLLRTNYKFTHQRFTADGFQIN
ncbi:MAG: hypothetical protein CVU03_02550 [Bacteroidetes bacterium HGW-Bacteroidetes-2]|jgi:hypothetical protein|nr:MAG: hypothetical protein CVU13_05765 [Bacteroidetes bacterium HGW-Bacteroidetes-8]PKP26772.1 MAG: hypothetical protein CVU03_02550 [Bacteroidetes bacterium HGW-Bacteroidetes-2]